MFLIRCRSKDDFVHEPERPLPFQIIEMKSELLHYIGNDRIRLRLLDKVLQAAGEGHLDTMRTFIACLSPTNKIILEHALRVNGLLLWHPLHNEEFTF